MTGGNRETQNLTRGIAGTSRIGISTNTARTQDLSTAGSATIGTGLRRA